MRQKKASEKKNPNLIPHAYELEERTSNGESGHGMHPPAFSLSNTQILQAKPNDTVKGLFGDEEEKITTETGFDVNNPEFDSKRMRKELAEAEFEGAGSDKLREAMITLQGKGGGNWPSGAEADKALAIIAEIRNIDFKKAKSDYLKIQKIANAGEERGKKHGHDSVSPRLDLKKHKDFMGSTSQLRFGMAMGDVFGVDPVFGSLISPTGGAVGPGNESISDAHKNNPTVMHGTAHDAAGYLKNAHGIGPGYNYLKRDWELDRTDPMSGQTSGVPYFSGQSTDVTSIATLLTTGKNMASDLYKGKKINKEDAATRASISVTDGNTITNILNHIPGLGGDSVSRGLTGAMKIPGKAKGLASDAWNTGYSKYSNIKNILKQLPSKAWNAASEKISGAWNAIPKSKQVKHQKGSEPTGDGLRGPHAYGSMGGPGNPDALRAGFGLGGVSYKDSNSSFLSAGLDAGKWKDPEGGNRYGLSASGGIGKGKFNILEMINGFRKGTVNDKNYMANLELGAGTASADAHLNPENGFSLGAQANAVEGAMEFGTKGTGNQDKSARLGLSAGIGAALRGHWGDNDNDKLREYGFGFDLGPVSADIKSEDPVRDILLPSIPIFGSGLANHFNSKTNLTQGASGLASDAYNTGKKGAKKIGGLASDTWGGAKKGWKKFKGLF